jgi:uncharacterized membrane protein
VVLLVIVLVGLVFRVYGLDSKSIWVDEMYSIKVSQYSLSGIIEETSQDVHPPLYYILLHFMVKWFGHTEFAVRLLSAIVGSLSILMAFQVGKILFERKTGLLFSLILGFSVYHIRYSQEARMYSLLVLLALISFYFFIRLLQERNVVSAVGYILATTLLAYTHVFALFIIFVQNAYVVLIICAMRQRLKYRPNCG